MKLVKWFGYAGLVIVLLITVACRNSGSTPNKNTNANIPPGAAADISAKIDYGLFCGDGCQEVLTLEAPRESIKGKVGVVASGTFPYGSGTMRMAEEAAKKYFPNMEVIIGNGKSDPVIQSSVIDDFIAQKVDVLVIDLVEKDTVDAALKRAKAAGIPIILIDRWTSVEPLTLIKAEDVEVGRKAGQQVVALLGGKGNVVEIKGTAASTTTIDRNKGILEAFEGYPRIKIIESMNANFDQGMGFKMMEHVLQRFPSGEISAVVSHADVMTMGAIEAIKAAGREDEIIVVSVDAQETALEAVEKGEIHATVAYPIVMPMGLIAAAKTIAGESMPKFIELEAPIVTKENVSKYKGITGY
ncbi:MULTISPECIES: substrate-binding domain-containing protein [unclassified Paenibacillus]|uniref:substrate-binding domain-containing protein n=1 Tax=unclassified Paenibacillus TaxID=185978 RepID=UPI00240694BD|nr:MULTISPECIES: substrate-binding domain-containing protein [unclassified Paenibacillus]MDF9841738.1 ribose transport system substrate-binding protein [Paenibacillus sp. PastF-2]MDF9848150.1 ribose transport system substrate-binding protein [Paenibacillus sp. PastM-2]MDF9854897.1 ribose transport system substrate-binding protein [Paenibacillus sp. PastF-1]MDH6480167.1 ribose transport system substrate-binding protein [Paenibacillus sp. PastH-2]MDH6507597.1 ribose transport system substrate-bi